ncbi:cyclic pyranopterin monophosphate synthase MoaC [Propionibacterium freudenreichii]|nr:cyclic pyranopterin monophosphate synthase MoaC [Propionibacterium freudenreichii]
MTPAQARRCPRDDPARTSMSDQHAGNQRPDDRTAGELPHLRADGLPHLRADGTAYMVDVTGKQPTVREATAVARVDCSPAIMAALQQGTVPKGDVLAVARIAGIQAAKHTPDLLPLAHVIGVHGASVNLELAHDHVDISATVRTADRTGVEMEALTAVTVAALAVVDMVKGVDRMVEIRGAKVVHKAGGRSGDWTRPGDD